MTRNSSSLELPEIHAGPEAGPAYIRKCGYTISVRLYILEIPLHIKAPVFNILAFAAEYCRNVHIRNVRGCTLLE